MLIHGNRRGGPDRDSESARVVDANHQSTATCRHGRQAPPGRRFGGNAWATAQMAALALLACGGGESLADPPAPASRGVLAAAQSAELNGPPAPLDRADIAIERIITHDQLAEARAFARWTRGVTIAGATTASVLTEVALARPGFAEGNPLMRSRAARWAGKPALYGAALWGLDSMIKSDDAGTRRWGRILAVAAAVVAAADAATTAIRLSRGDSP